MRIVILGHCYAMPENRIKWKRFAELFPDCDVTLIVPNRYERKRYGDFEEHCVESEEYANYRLIALRQISKLRNLYLGLGCILRKTKPDIFAVIESYDSWIMLQAILCKLLFVPKAMILGFSDQNIPVIFTKWFHIKRHSFSLRNLHAMYAYNEECVKLLREKGFTKPVLVQENTGIDERIWYPDSKARTTERNRLGLNSFVIGYVGALIEEKGILDLVRAVRCLKKDWHLLLVGGGPLRIHIESLTKQLGIFNRIKFIGYVTRKETAMFYRCMDVLVLSSRTTSTWKEQFGVVLAEAMLSGVPVIGSNSGAIPEVIGNAGLIFPEGDIQSLVGCLQQLHDDSILCQELAKKGRLYALDKYCITAMAKQNYNFFKQLLSECRD